jgi:hypothetical protein
MLSVVDPSIVFQYPYSNKVGWLPEKAYCIYAISVQYGLKDRNLNLLFSFPLLFIVVWKNNVTVFLWTEISV